RPERENPRIVDQNIDMAVAELDRSLGHGARARRVAKLRRDKIGFASCGTDVRNRLLAAFCIAAYDDDMDANLGQFIGCRPANTVRSSCNKCCQRIGSHWQFPLLSCCFTSIIPLQRALGDENVAATVPGVAAGDACWVEAVGTGRRP